MDKQAPSDLGSRYYLLRLLRRNLQFDVPPKADMSSAANAVSSYPFFAGQEGKNPCAPIWSEIERPMRIRNNGRQDRDRSSRKVGKRGDHRALIGSASSVQTHRKPGACFGRANRDS